MWGKVRAIFTFPLNTTRIQQCKISDFLKVVHSWSGTLNRAVASCIVRDVTATRAEVAESSGAALFHYRLRHCPPWIQKGQTRGRRETLPKSWKERITSTHLTPKQPQGQAVHLIWIQGHWFRMELSMVLIFYL